MKHLNFDYESNHLMIFVINFKFKISFFGRSLTFSIILFMIQQMVLVLYQIMILLMEVIRKEK